jgi:hypothetical protein
MLVSWCHLVVLFVAGAQTAQVPPLTTDFAVSRAARVEALRAKAKEQIEQERATYSARELEDIEARYRAAHREDVPMFLRRDAAPILLQLIADYPKSHRSGCAVLHLARLASGEERERYLKQAIGNHGDAWCESGVQVGALARARLAVQYAALEMFDEAERLAEELVTLFPGAIDESGASLDDVLKAVRLLRHPGGRFEEVFRPAAAHDGRPESTQCGRG